MSIEVRDSVIHGKGVFTGSPVGKHSLIARMNVVREITEEQPLDPEKGELHRHCHWYPDGRVVLTGEPYCYTNHSCSPSAFLCTVNGISYVIAMRNIDANEEISLDYSLCGFDGEVWECRCGSSGCRGVHRCGFRHLDRQSQISLLPYLDPIITAVHRDYIAGILAESVPDS